jgi:hypothetical protein
VFQYVCKRREFVERARIDHPIYEPFSQFSTNSTGAVYVLRLFTVIGWCQPEALNQIRVSGLAIIIKRLSFHLRFTAPEAVFSDGYRPSEAFIADIARLYR